MTTNRRGGGDETQVHIAAAALVVGAARQYLDGDTHTRRSDVTGRGFTTYANRAYLYLRQPGAPRLSPYGNFDERFGDDHRGPESRRSRSHPGAFQIPRPSALRLGAGSQREIRATYRGTSGLCTTNRYGSSGS